MTEENVMPPFKSQNLLEPKVQAPNIPYQQPSGVLSDSMRSMRIGRDESLFEASQSHYKHKGQIPSLDLSSVTITNSMIKQPKITQIELKEIEKEKIFEQPASLQESRSPFKVIVKPPPQAPVPQQYPIPEGKVPDLRPPKQQVQSVEEEKSKQETQVVMASSGAFVPPTEFSDEETQHIVT